MIKRALTEPRTYGMAITFLAFCTFVYLIGSDPMAPLLDWAVGGVLFFMSFVYFINPSVFCLGLLDDKYPKRPTIQYLIAEGFIDLIPNEDDFSYTIKVDTSKCPWAVEVTYLSSYTEIQYTDDPGEAYVFDNKMIDLK